MQTQCPHCQTLFRLTDEQLRAADGLVRCGHCHIIYNALDDADLAKHTQNTAENNNERAHINERDDNGGARLHNKTGSPVKHSVSHKTNKPKTHNKPATAEPAAIQDVTELLFGGDEHKLIPDEFRMHHTRPAYSMLSTLAWSLAILLLGASLVVEYAWFNRNELVAVPELKPWMTKFCELADCEFIALRDPEQIEMLNRNVYSHPNIDEALMVNVTIINHASYAQPYPNVQIEFSNMLGERVAARIFSPEQYLRLDAQQISLLEPEHEVSFDLEIQDPGEKAKTYEFNFL